MNFLKLLESRSLLTVLIIALIVRVAIFITVAPFEGILPPVYADLEPYQDFKLLYFKDVHEFLEGSLPYSDFFHAYPPLFLYFLTALSFIPLGLLFPAAAMVTLDALTVIPVYLISKKLSSPRWALAVSVIYSISPIMLWYDAALWLNPPPSTLLMLISLLFYLREKPKLSAVCLGISAAFKQTTAIILPVLIIASWRNKNIRSSAIYLLFFSAPFLLVSIPYLLLDPYLYVWSLGLPGIPAPSPYAPNVIEWKYDISEPMNITMYLGMFGYVDISLAFKTYLPIIFAAMYIFSLYNMGKLKSFSSRDIIYYALNISLIFYTFFPRGIYKYYFVAILPLLVVLLIQKRHIILYEVLNLCILGIPRFLTPWLTLVLIPLSSFLKINSKVEYNELKVDDDASEKVEENDLSSPSSIPDQT